MSPTRKLTVSFHLGDVLTLNSIRLATHLYAENLLDRELYMEWLVQSLENSDQGKLPMWMLLTEIYWKDLLRLRKYGRRLVLALVRHHHEVRSF